MNQELKQIKKKYGEKFSHLCRQLFPTILENQGMLLEILMEHFEYNHFLYDDIVNNNLIDNFKDYIYTLFNKKIDKLDLRPKEKIKETPEELMERAGYILKECETEEEIQSYRKYYAPGEELCTFIHSGRLNTCRVFFAVKKNVSDIKRENFKNPRRQDEYGTSVISIQFTKDGTNTLSIKNRYNHTVEYPDATFSNDLDNIIAGLTESFENTYGIVQKYQGNNFEIPGYVLASDGKYYKYNYEINNIYYCPNNIIINNFKVKKYDKEKYIILDYFILDLVDKKLFTYDNRYSDSFEDGINNIVKINVLNEGENKRIILTPINGENIEIIINNKNQIIEYKNNNLEEIGSHFLYENKSLEGIELLKLKNVGHFFLFENKVLKIINCPNLQKVGGYFLYENRLLERVEFLNLNKVGHYFLSHNQLITTLDFPNLAKVGSYFLNMNVVLRNINCPNLIKVGNSFLQNNNALKSIQFLKLKTVGDDFIGRNEVLEEIYCPNLETVGSYFLNNNKSLKSVAFENLLKVGNNFIYFNEILENIYCPKLSVVGDNFLYFNSMLQTLNLESLFYVENEFLTCNEVLKEIYCPKLERVGDCFLVHNKLLKIAEFPSLKNIGMSFLYFNEELKMLKMSNLKTIDDYFLGLNSSLEIFEATNLDERYIQYMNPHIVDVFQRYKNENQVNKRL